MKKINRISKSKTSPSDRVISSSWFNFICNQIPTFEHEARRAVSRSEDISRWKSGTTGIDFYCHYQTLLRLISKHNSQLTSFSENIMSRDFQLRKAFRGEYRAHHSHQDRDVLKLVSNCCKAAKELHQASTQEFRALNTIDISCEFHKLTLHLQAQTFSSESNLGYHLNQAKKVLLFEKPTLDASLLLNASQIFDTTISQCAHIVFEAPKGLINKRREDIQLIFMAYDTPYSVRYAELLISDFFGLESEDAWNTTPPKEQGEIRDAWLSYHRRKILLSDIKRLNTILEEELTYAQRGLIESKIEQAKEEVRVMNRRFKVDENIDFVN